MITRINRKRIIEWRETLQPVKYDHKYKGWEYRLEVINDIRYSNGTPAFYQYNVHFRASPPFVLTFFARDEKELLFSIKKCIDRAVPD